MDGKVQFCITSHHFLHTILTYPSLWTFITYSSNLLLQDGTLSGTVLYCVYITHEPDIKLMFICDFKYKMEWNYNAPPR